MIGIKGKDGSGRTTLLKLIQGDIKPTTGRVTVGGFSTIEPDFLAARRYIAYVGAAPVIFSGTIMENLTVFSPEKRDFARKMSQLMGLEAPSTCFRTDTKPCSVGGSATTFRCRSRNKSTSSALLQIGHASSHWTRPTWCSTLSRNPR